LGVGDIPLLKLMMKTDIMNTDDDDGGDDDEDDDNKLRR
jgi:hypothetical protein